MATSIKISAKSAKAIERCKKEGETDSDVIGRALGRMSARDIFAQAAEGVDLKLSLAETDQSLKIICQMLDADFSEDKATACSKALFIDQSTETLEAAFKCFAAEGEQTISLDDFKKVVPVMVEDFPEEKLDELVKEVDSDGSGRIDSKEFARLILGLLGKVPFSFGLGLFKIPALKLPGMPEMPKMPELKMPDMPEMPKMPEMPSLSSAWSKSEDKENVNGNTVPAKDEEEQTSMSERLTPSWVKSRKSDMDEKVMSLKSEMHEKVTSLKSEMDKNVAGVATANRASLPGLWPSERFKVGKIMNKMTEAGYTEDKAESVCKALFCAQSKDELKAVFDLFDTEGKSAMSAADFTKMMPLLGEDMPEEKVAETLKAVDKDNSGKLELDEFCTLVSMLNPKHQAAEEKERAGSGWSLGSLGQVWSQESKEEGAKKSEPEAKVEQDAEKSNDTSKDAK